MKVGWQYRKLGDVCQVIAGQSPEGKYYNNEMNGLAFYQGKKEFSDKFLGAPTTWTTDITKEAIDGDVLMSVRAPVGPVNFATQKICIGRGLAAIRATEVIDREFLFNFLLKHESELIGNTGAVFNSINKTQIENIQIPLPPLPEQQRIVTILDEAFAGIAIATANAEKNLANARELFESHLQFVFTKGGEGWTKKPLGSICDLLNGFAFKSSDVVSESRTQLVRMGNLYGNKLDLDRSPVFYADQFAKDYQKYLLVEGDLIMSLTGTTGKEDYGYTVRIPESNLSLLMNQRIAKFDLIKEDIVNRDFLLYYLRSRVFLDVLYSTANGTRQANLSSVTIKSLPIPLCSMPEQKMIASSLKIMVDEIQRLEAIYQQKLVALEELKKSILNQAFSGKL